MILNKRDLTQNGELTHISSPLHNKPLKWTPLARSPPPNPEEGGPRGTLLAYQETRKPVLPLSENCHVPQLEGLDIIKFSSVEFFSEHI